MTTPKRQSGETVKGSPTSPVEGSPRPDWRDMPRDSFDAAAELGPLFDLTPDQVTAVDPCGTGDLLQLLEGPS